MRLRTLLQALLIFSLMVGQTTLLFIPFMGIALLKWLAPARYRAHLTVPLFMFAERWAYHNNRIADAVRLTQWHITGLEGLSADKNYLVIANHNSMADVMTLLYALNGHVPIFRFLLKEQLRYMPIVGLACWAMDFPFMRRYSAEYLAKHPEKATHDLETIRRSCEKSRHHPATIITFAEGTRFTPNKKQKQNSPYTYLLKPKAGGVGQILSAMGDKIEAILDITLIYPPQAVKMWQFMGKQAPYMAIDIDTIPVPLHFIGRDYQNDPTFRREVQAWLNTRWQRKDNLIASKRSELSQQPSVSA